MTIKQLLIDAQAIQVGVKETDWQKIIYLAARPLVAHGYVEERYGQAVIDSTLDHGAYYVFDEGIAMPHARPECGVIKNGFSLVLLDEPVQFHDSDKADIVIMFAACDSNAHIQEGIRAIVTLLDDEALLSQLRRARTPQQVVDIL